MVCAVTEKRVPTNLKSKGDLKMANANYRTLTVRDLVEMVSNDKKNFPKGLDTPIVSGDFEGNYHHIMHEAWHVYKIGKEKSILLCYELHEDNGTV